MHKQNIPGGTIHKLPEDIHAALCSSPKSLETWMDITPLARSDWICWMTSAKKAETRMKRIPWGMDQLKKGQRRPCCWVGCMHRKK